MAIAAEFSENFPNKDQIAAIICTRLRSERERMLAEFHQPGRVASAFIDNLLPEEYARQIYQAFPQTDRMRRLRTLREDKFVGAQMNRFHPLLEEAVFAFQAPEVVQLVGEITGLKGLQPDEHLYAGGVSLMIRGNFLNPHLDNSHDKDRKLYRVLNLLYYVTPYWPEDQGGNLELWDHGPGKSPRQIHSRFNRLVLMQTDTSSWHSVNPITAEGTRCCVSNYYFSEYPAERREYFHVTSFRARPGQTLRNLALIADEKLRMGLRRVFRRGIIDNPHVYKKDEKDRQY